jgi:DNA-binding XRE family transcriptional regulator
MANLSKLTSDQISEMRRLYEEGATQKSLAEKYNVSISTVVNKLKAKPHPAIAELGITPDELAEARQVVLAEPVMEQLKKKEKPKRRIVGVNI